MIGIILFILSVFGWVFSALTIIFFVPKVDMELSILVMLLSAILSILTVIFMAAGV